MNRLHKVNDYYFEKINTEDRAYFLGFLMADGCVFKIKDCINSYIVQIKLNIRDKNILDKFVEYLQTTYKVLVYRNEEYTNGRYCVLTLRSTRMAKDLIRHGCVERKSLKLKFPKTVPNKLIHHFIRGYFDGDGCVSFGQNKKRFNIVGTFNVLNNIQKILITMANLNKTKIANAGSFSFRLEYGGNKNVANFYNFLYKDAKLFLSRKREKFEE